MNNGKFCRMIDLTDRYPIPPPHYNFSTSKTSVFLKPGQSEKIQLKIKNNADFNSVAKFDYSSINGLDVEISPPILTLPSNSIVTSLLKIKALEKADVRPYTLSITSTIYPNQTIYAGRVDITGDIHQQLLKENIPLTITVEEPIGLLEYVTQTLSAWGTPIQQFIALVTAIGGAAVTGWVYLNKFRGK